MRIPCVSLAVALFIGGFGSKAISQTVTPLPDDRYAPSRFGIPESIGGYSVFAILTGDNFACMRPGEIRVILRSPEPTIKDGPRDFPHALIEQALQARQLTDSAQWESSVVGPGVTREQLVREFDQSNRFFNHRDCPTPTLSLASSSTLAALGSECTLMSGTQQTGGEWRCSPPEPGFANIQNFGPDTYRANNGQSVILIAPDLRNGNAKLKCGEVCLGVVCQPRICGGYIGFLNNGMTDKSYFLQVGLYFTNRPDLGGNIPDTLLDPNSGCVNLVDPGPDRGNPFSPNGLGIVVWAGAKIETDKVPDLQPRLLCVPYVPGHHYYTTIAYSSATWWTCAADIQDTTTYRCREHPGAKATGSTRLIKHATGTNVSVENWNADAGRSWGLPPQVVAYGARIHTEGAPPGGHPWPNEAKWTQHSCNDKTWPPESAIVQSSGLVQNTQKDGYAYFNTNYIPAFCP